MKDIKNDIMGAKNINVLVSEKLHILELMEVKDFMDNSYDDGLPMSSNELFFKECI